ncbi:MAG: 1,2-phenylacetyl-CoA epoxidase subunit PaaC [Pseudomonadales bacterium]|nr:phenylacetate-CoA oxygenase subunit PaaC [Pseudomonadales bacterium]
MTSTTSERQTYVLRLADTHLLLGQRLAEWIGHAPALEEELAIANLSLDCLGQARALLTYAGELEGAGRDADALAFLREPEAYCHINLAEQDNGDFATTIVRQVLVDAWRLVLLEALESSSDERLAGIAADALIEARYHWRFSRGWLVRLGDGTRESQTRTTAAVTKLWKFTRELFAADAIDQAMAAAGIGPDLAALRADWDALIDAALAEARLQRPGQSDYRWFGKRGEHTELLGPLLAEMQFLQRTYPGARW